MPSLLSTFTPSMMAPDALESLFVQRHTLAAKLLELLRESSRTRSKHYTLIVGPRGIGKTHLASLLYHRVRADQELRGLRIAWLKEEEWGIESFRDFLLRILTTLSTEYSEARLFEDTEALFKRPEEEVEALAGRLLKTYVGQGTLLLIVENLDQVFQGLGELGQKRFRAYVQESEFFTILATATSLFSAVARRTSPFYGFFRVEHLTELTLSEAIELLRNIARFKGNVELANLLLTPLGRARIRAVHHLAGGNHRIYVIFSQFLTTQSLDELVAPLVKTIDDLTPYYQSRMTDVSPQQRRIVELLAHQGGALTVREIAQRSFATQQTVSRQLRTLLDLGYVRVTPIGRESYYELREPLMRLCLEVKKSRAEPVRLLVDFLRLWYSPSELRERLALLPAEASWERRCLAVALEGIQSTSDDPRVAACLKDLRMYVHGRDWNSAVATAEELTILRGSSTDWESYSHCLGHAGRWDDALGAAEKALELDADNVEGLRRKVWILSNMGRHSEALRTAEKEIELRPDDPVGWENLGDAHLSLESPAEALTAYERAIALGRKESVLGKADALRALGRREDALITLGEALKTTADEVRQWLLRAKVLHELGRQEEALDAINKAITMEPDWWDLWTGKGDILCKLGRHAEEVEAFRKVVSRTDDVRAWQNLAMALMEAHAPAEALEANDKALGRKDTDASVWHVRGRALLELGRSEEALVSLERAESLGDRCESLPVQKAQAFVAVGRWDQALRAVRTALGKERQEVESEFSAVMRQLFESIPVKDWAPRADEVVRSFSDANALQVLGAALVGSIGALKSRPADAQAWYTAWDRYGKEQPDLQLALRLLGTVVRFYQLSDRRVLFELPVEERNLLLPLLGIEKLEGEKAV